MTEKDKFHFIIGVMFGLLLLAIIVISIQAVRTDQLEDHIEWQRGVIKRGDKQFWEMSDIVDRQFKTIEEWRQLSSDCNVDK